MPSRISCRRGDGIINPSFDLPVTRLTQHLFPHLRLDVVLPVFVGDVDHFRPKRAAFGAKVRIHDEWDRPLLAQEPLPLLVLLLGETMRISPRSGRSVDLQLFINTATANQLTAAKRTALHVASGKVKLPLLHAAVM